MAVFNSYVSLPEGIYTEVRWKTYLDIKPIRGFQK